MLRRFPGLLLTALLSLSGPLTAEEAKGARTDRPVLTEALVPNFESSPAVTALAEALRSRVRSLLIQQGFPVVGTPGPDTRFQTQGRVTQDKEHLLVEISIFDRQFHALAVSDMLAVYNGVTSTPVLDQFVDNLVQRLKSYLAANQVPPNAVPPLEGPLVFTTAQNGVQVFWRDHESIGTTADGQLTAPYFPFPNNGNVTLLLTAPGYEDREITIQFQPEVLTYPLPLLQKPLLREWVGWWGTGRLLGAGVDYREFLVPGWSFWTAGGYLWFQARPGTAGSGFLPHLDLGAGIGTFLFFPPSDDLRFWVMARFDLNNAIPVSAHGVHYYLDASLAPIDFGLQWRLSGLTLIGECRMPYALGITPNNLLGQRWMLVNGIVPQFTLGMVLPW